MMSNMHQGITIMNIIHCFRIIMLNLLCSPKRGWAALRSSAILRQPAEWVKQASDHIPSLKLK